MVEKLFSRSYVRMSNPCQKKLTSYCNLSERICCLKLFGWVLELSSTGARYGASELPATTTHSTQIRHAISDELLAGFECDGGGVLHSPANTGCVAGCLVASRPGVCSTRNTRRNKTQHNPRSGAPFGVSFSGGDAVSNNIGRNWCVPGSCLNIGCAGIMALRTALRNNGSGRTLRRNAHWRTCGFLWRLGFSRNTQFAPNRRFIPSPTSLRLEPLVRIRCIAPECESLEICPNTTSRTCGRPWTSSGPQGKPFRTKGTLPNVPEQSWQGCLREAALVIELNRLTYPRPPISAKLAGPPEHVGSIATSPRKPEC